MAGIEQAKVWSVLRKGMLGAAPLATTLVALQAASPLEGTPAAPAWLNWVCLVLVTTMLLWFLVRGQRVEQALSPCVLLVLGYAVLTSEVWIASSRQELASLLARALSSTWHGVATLAVLLGWSILGLAFLAARACLLASEAPQSVGVRATSWLIGAVIAIFGVRGLIGYASGNLSLLNT